MDCAIADGRALNIGHGRNLSINRIAALFGGPTMRAPARPGDARHTLSDCHAAEQVLGWRPRVTIEEGLAELIGQATETSARPTNAPAIC